MQPIGIWITASLDPVLAGEPAGLLRLGNVRYGVPYDIGHFNPNPADGLCRQCFGSQNTD
jgi:hypothetical protein